MEHDLRGDVIFRLAGRGRCSTFNLRAGRRVSPSGAIGVLQLNKMEPVLMTRFSV